MRDHKVMLIPGNGGSTPEYSWFPYLERKLPELGCEVINVQFPDPILARTGFWLPFLEKLGANEHTILIGHSSGTLAALRFAETHRIYGSVLVAAYHTHLNEEAEKQSGYFDQPWDWPAIQGNQNWIIQFASTDDPFIPIEEARYVHQKLSTKYHEYSNQKHFGHGVEQKLEFPELLTVLAQQLKGEIR